MAIEIRAITGEEQEEFTRVAATALGVTYEAPWPFPPEVTLCAFEDGKLVSSYAALERTMYFNGRDVPVAAISAVGTLPVHRRKGHLRRIITTHFQRMHEEGKRPISILWPSQGAIYQRYGYSFVSTHSGYSIEPGFILFTEPLSQQGDLSEVTSEDTNSISELYDTFCKERTGYLQRPPERWNEILQGPPAKGRVAGKVIYRETGIPKGYLLYSLEASGPGFPNQKITVFDLTYLNMHAYHAMWNYLAGLDLIGTINWSNVPQDDPLPFLLEDPRKLSPAGRGGIMGRIVDVEKALTTRNYPVSARLTFEIRDELCPWNNGCWELETGDGKAAVRRTTHEPQLVMPVSTLALLVFNHVTATQAARIGYLEVCQPEALATWDDVMRTVYRPFCADHF